LGLWDELRGFEVISVDIKESELIGCSSLDRFFAAIVDNLLAVVIAFVVALKLAAFDSVAAYVAAAFCYFGYYFLSEVLLGNTFGKWSSGLRVRTVSGGKCTRSQMSIRSLLRVVETNPVLFGGIPAGIAILLSPRRQRIGDRIAGTVVVHRSQIA